MSIRFQCADCGHVIDLDDHLAGMRGHCKHCGHPVVVPGPDITASEPPLRLKPLPGNESPGLSDALLEPQAPLQVRPAEAEPRVSPSAISAPVATEPEGFCGRFIGRGGTGEYPVLDANPARSEHSTAGPLPSWMTLPSATARILARVFRSIRDWLYLVSIFFLVVMLFGYLLHARSLLHVGVAGVIASNISMLCAGVAYLITLPFKESWYHGLANLVFPPYAIYYWATRWGRMKKPVMRTVASFLPIFLAVLALVIYKEGPLVEKAIERELPVLEKTIEDDVSALEKNIGVGAESQAVGKSPGSKRDVAPETSSPGDSPK